MTNNGEFTVIYDEKPIRFARAIAEADALWLEAADLARETGWQLKPEGLCRGALCYPIPASRRTEMARQTGSETWLNFTALADLMDQPWASDQKHRVWYFGTEAAARGNQLRSLAAPDFELPDLAGKMHRLSDYRGTKVFLLAWASW